MKNDIALTFESADKLIRCSEIDAIYIATPPSSHAEYALKAANEGKPCCVEKPLSNRLSDAADMVDAFEKTGTPLFVAYYRRSLPRFVQVKDLISQGYIGEIRHIQWELARKPKPDDIAGAIGWRTQSSESSAGYFDDLACHGFDLFDWLLGPIVRADGFLSNQQKLYDVADAVSGSWIHESGVTGSGFWNFGSFKRLDTVKVIGANGMITFSVFDEEPIRTEGRNSRELVIPNPDPIQLPHVQNMLKTLNGDFVHPSTGKSALRTATVMDNITRP